jgi:hypothetical protein
VKAIVGDRRSGKTTALVKWLVEGHEIPEYPGWSRVIVVATVNELKLLDSEVKQFGRKPDEEWEPKPYMKCVLHMREFLDNRGAFRYVRGESRVEAAFDNLDHAFEEVLGFRPAVVTMTADEVSVRTASDANWDSRGQITTLRSMNT